MKQTYQKVKQNSSSKGKNPKPNQTKTKMTRKSLGCGGQGLGRAALRQGGV